MEPGGRPEALGTPGVELLKSGLGHAENLREIGSCAAAWLGVASRPQDLLAIAWPALIQKHPRSNILDTQHRKLQAWPLPRPPGGFSSQCNRNPILHLYDIVSMFFSIIPISPQ